MEIFWNCTRVKKCLWHVIFFKLTSDGNLSSRNKKLCSFVYVAEFSFFVYQVVKLQLNHTWWMPWYQKATKTGELGQVFNINLLSRVPDTLTFLQSSFMLARANVSKSMSYTISLRIENPMVPFPITLASICCTFLLTLGTRDYFSCFQWCGCSSLAFSFDGPLEPEWRRIPLNQHGI